MEKTSYYLGIDLDNDNAVISYFQLNMKEPETVSTVAGSEVYQIPLILAKKRGIGQWFIGEEAKRLALLQGEEAVSGLLQAALAGKEFFIEGETYKAQELLALYIKKLVYLAGKLGNPVIPDFLVITLEQLSREVTELFLQVAERIGIPEGRLTLIDRRESFYYFAFSQQKELWLHDVCLFDNRGDEVWCRRLERDQRTMPQLVTISEEQRNIDRANKDASFLKIVSEVTGGHIVSAVYLTGDGFDGEWMKESLSFLCKGRRVFMGKNLYSKGACYAAAGKCMTEENSWQFVYMGDNEMKVNVSLKVQSQGKTEFFTLISAGDNWYETVGECEVLLDGSNEIDFWLQLPNSKEAKIEKLTLADLPERPPRTTRLRIKAQPVSDMEVKIRIKDLGFGEIFKSSDKTWEYMMSLENVQ